MDFLGIGDHFGGEYEANSVMDTVGTVVPSVHDIFEVFVILGRFGPENLSDRLVVEGWRVEKSEEGVVNVVAANAPRSTLCGRDQGLGFLVGLPVDGAALGVPELLKLLVVSNVFYGQLGVSPDVEVDRQNLVVQVWPLNQIFSVSFLWKLIDLPSRQIDLPRGQ